MAMQRFLNSLEEKITAHYGTIYLISFTYVARLCASNLAKHIKNNFFIWGRLFSSSSLNTLEFKFYTIELALR